MINKMQGGIEIIQNNKARTNEDDDTLNNMAIAVNEFEVESMESKILEPKRLHKEINSPSRSQDFLW